MNVTTDSDAHAFLRRCATFYEALVAEVLRRAARGDDEDTLRWVGLAATAAWVAHPGRFADQRLESIAVGIGQRMPLDPTCASPAADMTSRGEKQRRVLHVATVVYETGGHTRLMENWIENDPASLHSLVLTNQEHRPVRSELRRRVQASGGELIVMPTDCRLLDKAAWLRRVAQSGYDCLILHHHPNDVLPLVALATPDCPPVAVMNHADHIFWLGVSVADLVLIFRDFSARLSRDRRGARSVMVLPVPLDFECSTVDRAEARALLGIPDDEVVLFTMGSADKFRPTEKHDFFRTLGRVLDANPSTRLYVVGVNPNQFRSFGVARHERIELLGILSDPSLYVAAADLNLSGFPIPSYTALFETAARGVCPVLMYAPNPQADLSGDPALNGLITSATDETDYVERVTALINDRGMRERLGRTVAEQIASTNLGDGWRARLQDVYRQLAAHTHHPAPISVQGNESTADDLNLARFNKIGIQVSVLYSTWNSLIVRMTLGDLIRAFVISLGTGDTRLSSSRIKSSLGLFWRQLFPPQRTRVAEPEAANSS